MFPRTIRWRLQLWLAFLLVCVLIGFGVVVMELQRVSQFNQLDTELQRRVVSVSGAVRGDSPGPPPFANKGGSFDFERGGKGPPPGPPPDGKKEPPPDGWKERPSFEGRKDGSGFGRGGKGPPSGPPGFTPSSDSRGMPFGRREVQLSPEVAGLFDDPQPNAFYYSVWLRGVPDVKSSTTAPAALPQPLREGTDTSIQTRTREEWREAWHFTELGDCVLVGRAVAGDLGNLRRFGWNLLGAGAAVLAFGLGGGWWLTTRAIKPVEEISAAASRISAGNLTERIKAADPENELGRLASVLNSTFARLDAAFAQQKQFTADAAHELRTPIAVLISEAQTVLSRERTTAEYRDAVQECLVVAQQMRRLTESLLDLSRLDSGHEPLMMETVQLDAVVTETVALVRSIAAHRDVKLLCELAPASCRGDAHRLGQVVTNLVTNAIVYNRTDGEVRVTLSASDGQHVLEVADTGCGVAPEDLPYVFDRFFRADESRARTDGHAGLGLAIVKTIVEAHLGTITVKSELGKGSTFTVKLPAAR